MENRLYDNEFEELLKTNANQHRMYPSDQVWRNIQGEVHGYKKWPALTVIAVFIIAALVISTLVVKPHNELALSPANISSINTNEELKMSSSNASVENTKSYAGHLSVVNITQQTIAKVTEAIQTNEAEEILIIPPAEIITNENLIAAVNVTDKQLPAITTSAQRNTNNIDDKVKDDVTSSVATNNKFPDARFIFSSNFTLPTNGGYYFSNAVYKSDFSFVRNTNNNAAINLELSASPQLYNSPLSQIGKKSSRLDFQVYATPSISYRRLVDDVQGSLAKSYITALPYAANYVVDLNHVIQHRPAAGYEIGFSLGYNIGKKFAIRSGIQFNTRQYNIDAFAHTAEPAAVALSANNSNLVYNTVSGFRNLDGSKPLELKNRYYEIAVPIGIDWRPINKKFAWGIAASIQPTYTFDKEPFIISSNYKNYADGSQLMRNWNINANFETYLGYNTGKYRWQIGPQFRYQVMATMANSFPIREYPLDFGLKLGLIRSLR